MTKEMLKQKFLTLNDEQLKQLRECTSEEELCEQFKKFVSEDFANADLIAAIKALGITAEDNAEAVMLMLKINDIIASMQNVQTELATADDNISAYKILQPYLADMTLEKFTALCQSARLVENDITSVQPLSDQDLDAVIGGSWKSFWRGFKTGFVDTFKIIGSAAMVGFNVFNHNPNMAEKWCKPLEKNVKHLSDALHNR